MRITETKIRQIIREELTRHLSEGWEGGSKEYSERPRLFHHTDPEFRFDFERRFAEMEKYPEKGRHGYEGLGRETDDIRSYYDGDNNQKEKADVYNPDLQKTRSAADKEASRKRIAQYEDMLDIHQGSIMKAFPDRDPYEIEDILVAMIKEKGLDTRLMLKRPSWQK